MIYIILSYMILREIIWIFEKNKLYELLKNKDKNDMLKEKVMPKPHKSHISDVLKRNRNPYEADHIKETV